MITWHVGTLLVKPAAIHEDHYVLLFSFGAGAGLGVGLLPGLMAAEMIRRVPAFRPVALRMVLCYGAGLLMISAAMDLLRVGSLVTPAALLALGMAVSVAPMAIAGSLCVPEALTMSVVAVLPLSALLWAGYRGTQRLVAGAEATSSESRTGRDAEGPAGKA